MKAVVESYIPPHNVEAEMCALGAMLRSERAHQEVMAILQEEDFYRPAHRQIFQGIQQLVLESKAVDLVTLKNELASREMLAGVGGVEYLIQVASSVPSPSNAAHYAQIVLDQATLRRLEETGYGIASLVHESDLTVQEKVDRAEQYVYEVGRKRLGKYFAPAKELAADFFKDVDRLNETGVPILGITSGFADLDRKTSGFYGGEMTIVAARPSMGKTSLVLNFALAAARERAGCIAVFSLEMSGKSIVRRMVSMISGVSMTTLKQPNLSNDDYQRLADATELLYGLPVYVDDSSDLSPTEMRGKLRRLMSEQPIAMVVVDYLQLMRSSKKTENRVQEISDVARSLKAIAKELDVPVLALSQLNRGVESREDKRPQLSDLRESGSIEAEADVVMLIYRDNYYKKKSGAEDVDLDPDRIETAEIIIAKHRNGPTGRVLLAFEPRYARFRPYDSRSDAPED